MWPRIVAGGIAALAACYSPAAQPGLPCSEPSHTCPGDQVCDESRIPPTCVENPGGPDGGGDGDAAAIECQTSATCPAATPVCDPTVGVCRGCIDDAECTGGACHELAGTCVADAAALFVSPTGSDNASCARATPCLNMQSALDLVTAARSFIAVADGTYSMQFDIKQRNNVSKVTISGTDRSWDGPVFSPSIGENKSDPGIDAIIEGVTFANAPNDGIVIRSDVTLSRVLVRRSGRNNVDVRGGSVTVLDSKIESATSIGINTSNLLTCQRSQVLGNQGGGIQVTSQAGFTIVNTVIANNGGLSGMFGGAKLASSTGKPAVFRFNTVTKNTAGAAAPSVICDSAFTVENSIVYDNMAFLVSEFGSNNCSAKYSLFTNNAPSGTGNLTGNPMFVTPSSDFHLQAGSPAIDKADPAATESVDLDSAHRPVGGGRDIGADERP